MGVMRVHKSKNFTVMSNYHFREKEMSLKAKGLLSLMLSLPDDWDYSVSGLTSLSKDGKDAVMAGLTELEKFGYLTRKRLTNSKGQFQGVEYNIYEQPQSPSPVSEESHEGSQNADNSNSENPPQLNTELTKDLPYQDTNVLRTKAEEAFGTILETSVVSDTLRELYYDYIETRETMKHPLTRQGLRALIRRCEKLTDRDIEMQKVLLEMAIINNWKNVYSPRENDVPPFIRENSGYKHLFEIYAKKC